MMNKVIPLSLIALGLTLFSGCGKPAPSDLPKLEKCTATVKMDGSSLSGAAVNFSSATDSKWFAFGVTDEQGVATMVTQAEYPGVPAGDYIVTVSKEGDDPTAPVNPEAGGNTVLFVDSKFANRDSSPLKCTVKEGENNFEFEVEAPKK